MMKARVVKLDEYLKECQQKNGGKPTVAIGPNGTGILMTKKNLRKLVSKIEKKLKTK